MTFFVHIGRRNTSLVEELRPSILDNFDLFVALKWHLKNASEGSGAELTESYPSAELVLQPVALTALFTVAQEAKSMIFSRGGVGTAGISLRAEISVVSMRFTDDGVPNVVNREGVGAASAMTSMKHRIRAHGLTVKLERTATGGSALTAHMPLVETAGHVESL